MKKCAITDGSAETRPEWLIGRCAELAAAGLDLLLLRERELPPAELLRFTRRVVAAVAGRTPVLVAGPPALALEAGAAGVHLSARPGELTPAQARELFPSAYLSQSCHTLDEVRQARERGADAILFGPVFGKSVAGVEVVPGVGLALLAEAVRTAAPVAVYALGGITAANAGGCPSAGIAAIRMYFGEST